MKKLVNTGAVLPTKDRSLYLNHPQNRDRHAFHVFDRPALFAPCSEWVRRVNEASRVFAFWIKP